MSGVITRERSALLLAVATVTAPFVAASAAVSSHDRSSRVLMLAGCGVAAIVLVKGLDRMVMRRKYVADLWLRPEFIAGMASFGLTPMNGGERPPEWSSLELVRRPVLWADGGAIDAWAATGVVHGRQVALVGRATTRGEAAAWMVGVAQLAYLCGEFLVAPRSPPVRHRDDPPFGKEFKVKGGVADAVLSPELQRWLLDHCRTYWQFEVRGNWVACRRDRYGDPALADIGVLLAALVGFAELLADRPTTAP